MKGFKRVSVCTMGKNARDHPSFQKLGPQTSFVHINGYPFFWAVRLILEKAPNVKTIQIIPSLLGKISPNHQRLCQGRNVQIVGGWWKPAHVWGEREYRPHFYRQYRDFFLGLKEKQKELLDALILVGINEAIITSRYLCLKGENYVSQRIIAKKYGLCREGEVSRIVRALVYYFDPSFEVAERSKRTAKRIARRLQKKQSALDTSVVVKRLKIPKLPDGLRPRQLGDYEAVLMALRDGRIAALKKKHKRDYQVICLEFGLEDGVCRRLEDVASSMGSFNSRQRAGQIKRRGFERLGIR